MEVRYAKASGEVARLTKQNEQLQADLVGLVELKLQLAEMQAALREASDAGFVPDSQVAQRYLAVE